MKKIHEEIKKFLDKKILIKTLYVILILFIAILIFSAGIITGLNKGSFEKDWGEHYGENFGMGHMKGQIMGDPTGINTPISHGAIGKILDIQLPTLVVQDKDGTEKVILVNDDTGIEKVRNFIKVSDLKVGDFLVVIGSPNSQAQIQAKFIRVIPSPNLLNPNPNTNTNVQ